MLSVWLQSLVAPAQITRKSGSSVRGSSPIRAVPEEDEEPAEDAGAVNDGEGARSTVDDASEAAISSLAAGGGSAAQSDVASNASVAGSSDARRLASLAESPLEQVRLHVVLAP